MDVALEAGVTAFIGRNGQGKTNLVEAIDYLSRLSSHRVATDAPLVRAGTDQAIVRAAVVTDGRTAVLEVELNPGRANRARVNQSTLPRVRDLVGLVRTVIFSPEDLTLVKGDPSDRRRFLDDLLVLRTPRLAGVRADYDRVLQQRNSLLKTAGVARRGSSSEEAALSTLGVWDEHLARVGAELLDERLRLVDELRPYVGQAYETVARGASREDAQIEYRPSFELPGPDRRGPHRRPAGRGRAAPRRRARPRHLPGRSAPRRAAADAAGRPGPAGEGLRLARGVVVVRAGAAAGVVRPLARRRRRPDPDPGRRLRRARHRTAPPARRAGRRRRAGAGHRGGGGRRTGGAGRCDVHRGRRGGDRA